MKNIHLIKTDKPSRLLFDKEENRLLPLQKADFFMEHQNLIENQNIYITNSEEIKEGDWVYCTKRNLFGKVVEIQLAKYTLDSSMLYFEIKNEEIWCKLFNCEKIILTTDTGLIKDNVQAIDDEFLEWFVKNPSCESVEVEKGKMKLNDDGQEYGFPDMSLYKIIIPSEESKDDVLGYKTSLDAQMLDKIEPKQEEDEIIDISDHDGIGNAVDNLNNMPPQETLEESAERLYPFNPYSIGNGIKYDEYAKERRCFIAGAKWQQERSYSEEDMREAYFTAIRSTSQGWNGEHAGSGFLSIEKAFSEGYEIFIERYKNK